MANNQDYTIRVKRGTANEWAIYNPILGAGELGYDTTNRRLKVGDGLNVWSNVKFATGNSFDVARDAGFDGTLSQWLESLKGEDGVGPTNHITVGNVTTGPEPKVELRGESPNQIIDFTFPAAGEPIEYTPATPTKDGLMPKEDKATLDGASQYGKEFLTNADAAAARTNLGLSVGATSPTGTSSELGSGNQTNPRAWSPKTIADYVKAGDTTNSTNAKSYTDAAIDKVRTVVSVKDFGAVGDSIANDVQPFRDAIAAIEAKGGGTLMLESGKTYWIPDAIETCENLTIEGNKATIVKIKKTGHVRYAVFQSKKGQGLGYGAGANKNLTIRNVTFKGNLSTNTDEQMDICAFAGHHHDNVLIDNCTFLEASSAGHCVDLGGCSNVRVTNCQFIGFNPAVLNRAEAVQADRSTNGSLSAHEQSGNYDGLTCKNIIVSNCQFLPITKDGTNWPCPNPFGSHAITENNPPEGMFFLGNTVVDPCENTSDYQKGIIRFMGVRGLTIANNTFRTTTHLPNLIIGLEGTSTGFPATGDPEAPVSATLTTPVNCEDVIISNNIFDGFYGQGTACGHVRLYTTATKAHSNISITGNIFKNSTTLPLAYNNSSPGCVSATRVLNLTIANNILKTTGQLAYFNTCKDVTVANNRLSDVSTNSIYCSGVERFSVSNHTIYNHHRSAIVFTGAGGNISVTGVTEVSNNDIVTGNAISIQSGYSNIMISNIQCNSTNDKSAIVINSAANNGIVTNVIAKGATSVVDNAGTNITVTNAVTY